MIGTIATIFGDVPIEKATEWGLVEHYFEPIKNLFLNSDVTEIFIDRFDNISIEKNGQIENTPAKFESEIALQSFIVQIARCLGQQVDEDRPILDARLPDCSRLCCTLPTVSPQGATMTLRVVPKSLITAEQLVEFGALTQTMLDFLIEHIRYGSNIIVSGNTGSGKTTILRALAKYIPHAERVITCEDTQELYLDWLKYKVSLEAPKRPNSDVEMKHLIEAALRMRPDRIWVGEIRRASAADAFLQAINTGHSGCVTTLHANSCQDAVSRLQYLIASAGLISYELAGKQIVGAVNVLIHASRHPDYGRKVTEISIIDNGQVKPLFTFNTTTLKHEAISHVNGSISGNS
ncbi:CpaF family protein [Photobacterium frigidiphilum]|uniref:CpaF family protein n=1 Tax=Photobacterium frigidiphilum TaxID=264736 RepID=A0A2T3J7N3_9GAMM|nr:ATPase, T2SS/T4P/T4SS family [Photobacterium frigidiphilum]PSU44781.1 CpaF family protein [Photobacterium frigidiphilum]